MTHDVFISFKNSGPDGAATPDAALARKVYQALRDRGLKVFFSEESLAEAGRGNFSKSIETALESARILVLVASCREHIESRWVEAEWDSFLQDVRSGRKQGELFILGCGRLNPADLPLFLRRQQLFAADSLDKLVQFVGNALPQPVVLGDYIRASMHCFHPEKDEDKVYLLAVHPGSMGDAFHVTAFWGARSAKRLSSQMKAINVPAAAAKAEVAKARQDKLRSGYAAAPLARILTPEARQHLSAALGLVESPANKASRRPVAGPAPVPGTKPPAKLPAKLPAKAKLKAMLKATLEATSKAADVPKPARQPVARTKAAPGKDAKAGGAAPAPRPRARAR